MEHYLNVPANWIDLAVVVAVVGGLVLGASQGLVRQILALGGLYVSAVLALQYYSPVSRYATLLWPATDEWSRTTFGMAVVFLFSFLAMNLLSYYLYEETRLYTFVFLDRSGGAAAGAMGGWFLAALAVNLLGLSFRFLWGGWESIELITQSQFNQSSLVPILYSNMPMLLNMIKPWLPAGLPIPFLV